MTEIRSFYMRIELGNAEKALRLMLVMHKRSCKTIVGEKMQAHAMCCYTAIINQGK